MGRLATLQVKARKRVAGRKRQYLKWQATGKKGHLKAFRRHRKAVRYLRKLIKIKRRRQTERQKKAWGGSKWIMIREVRPVARKFGVSRTSSKRGARHYLTLLNPFSDHSILQRNSFADDYGTFDGKALAHAIAAKLGITGYSTGNFGSYTIWRNGQAYRVQILWAVDGHWNHVHVGIKRI